MGGEGCGKVIIPAELGEVHGSKMQGDPRFGNADFALTRNART